MLCLFCGQVEIHRRASDSRLGDSSLCPAIKINFEHPTRALVVCVVCQRLLDKDKVASHIKDSRNQHKLQDLARELITTSAKRSEEDLNVLLANALQSDLQRLADLEESHCCFAGFNVINKKEHPFLQGGHQELSALLPPIEGLPVQSAYRCPVPACPVIHREPGTVKRHIKDDHKGCQGGPILCDAQRISMHQSHHLFPVLGSGQGQDRRDALICDQISQLTAGASSATVYHPPTAPNREEQSPRDTDHYITALGYDKKISRDFPLEQAPLITALPTRAEGAAWLVHQAVLAVFNKVRAGKSSCDEYLLQLLMGPREGEFSVPWRTLQKKETLTRYAEDATRLVMFVVRQATDVEDGEGGCYKSCHLPALPPTVLHAAMSLWAAAQLAVQAFNLPVSLEESQPDLSALVSTEFSVREGGTTRSLASLTDHVHRLSMR